MTTGDSDGWLQAVLVGAKDANWCVRRYCTTCGCETFRLALWAAAARQAGIPCGFESAQRSRDVLGGLAGAQREVLVQTLVAGLRELSWRWSGSDAVETILLDLDPPFLTHGVFMDLDGELDGTPAGEALARLHARSEMRSARRERRQAAGPSEDPAAVAERVRLRREREAIEQARHLARSRQKNAERQELIAALTALSPPQRVARYVSDPALILDSVPSELIPLEADLVGIDPAVIEAFIKRIDRRKGAWGRFRRVLERHRA